MSWKHRARQLKAELYALAYAYRDPRVPWYAKVLTAAVVAYALSPIDLIPDPIPVLGYLDDLILLPLGILLVVRLIPPEVLAECRAKAHTTLRDPPPMRWVAAIVIVGIWVGLAAMGVFFAWRLFGS